MEQSLAVIILAAGLGTRMKSKQAKVLHCVAGRPLIDHVLRTASRLAAPGQIFVVTGYQAELVENHLAASGVNFVRQPEPKGTAHAVSVCRNSVPAHLDTILVLYGDCPLLQPRTLEQLLAHHRQAHADLTLLVTTLDDPTGYGRIVRAPDGSLLAIVEQKAATPDQLAIREINPGIYCFRAQALWPYLDRVRPDNPANEYYLTDMAQILREAGLKVETLSHPDARELLGINTRVELAEADRILRRRIVNRLMLEGVSIENPDTVSIDSDVAIGADTVIEPFARILGSTRIGEDCYIGAGAVIENSVLGNRVRVAPYTLISGSCLEDDVHIGPFARIRMECQLRRGSRVGNFVEMKKTVFGEGSKAMHLAYLGDSTVGSQVNIGAGTITCNYDGVSKHPTHIGDGAFIGSNSTLIAPIVIGPGSYVGAGSVITKPVPEDALAVAREQQIVKEGWARRRREKYQQSRQQG